MGSLSTLRSNFMGLLEPWIFITYSIMHIPATIYGLAKDSKFSTILSPSGFNEALFGTFWATIGPNIKNNAQQQVVPLLEGRVKGGHIHDEVVNTALHGTVLEVGAGSGMWTDVLARIATADGKITKIYGVEPNPISAKSLQMRVKDVGLEDLYEVVPVGIEDVDNPQAWNGKIEPGSVDCIIGVMCMCSIPEPEKNIRLLYKLLKPGGHWYVYEHVKAKRGWPFLPLYQRFVNIPWSFFMGSCRLCRDTEKSLRAAGAWEDIDLAPLPDSITYSPLPNIFGTLKKAA